MSLLRRYAFTRRLLCEYAFSGEFEHVRSVEAASHQDAHKDRSSPPKELQTVLHLNAYPETLLGR